MSILPIELAWPWKFFLSKKTAGLSHGSFAPHGALLLYRQKRNH
ncbi:MAG: hypothetical protein ABJB69_06570 [Spartobacteria bacterium]